MRIYVVVAALLLTHFASAQAVCTQTTVGFTPINDLGTGTWNSYTGGLYPGGSNYIPAAHKAAGLQLASQVVPLAANGTPDPSNGKIVFLSIGMSNCTQAFSSFIPMGNADPNKDPKVILVDGAQGGQTAQVICNPAANFWTVIDTRLQNAGVTANQVQAIWYKEANQAGSNPAPQAYADSIVAQSKRVMNILKTRYPNVKICYVASRIYAGYASTSLNPEPYAYWTGWAKKWLIEAQLNNDPKLVYSGAAANSPWLAWGTYNWADGLIPRSDGLTWTCPGDYANDGTHPSSAGAAKVASKLLAFLQTDSTACWYRGDCASTTGINEISTEGITIFPNPSSENFTLSLPEGITIGTITISDALGRTVYHNNALHSSSTIPCKNWEAGLYQIKLETGNTILMKKLLVVK